jgi:hypothetical protein
MCAQSWSYLSSKNAQFGTRARETAELEYLLNPTADTLAQLSRVNAPSQLAWKALSLPVTGALFAWAAPTSIAMMALDGGVGATGNVGAQLLTKDKIDWVDAGGAAITGAPTLGKGYMVSASINAWGGYQVASYNNEDPTSKVTGAVVGSFLGGGVGNFMERSALHAGLGAAITGRLSHSDLLVQFAQPASILTSTFGSETTNFSVDKLFELKNQKKNEIKSKNN